jgi:hypothetical protein
MQILGHRTVSLDAKLLPKQSEVPQYSIMSHP